MTDNTQELDEILEGVANEYSAGGNYENAKPLMVEEAEQAVLDWHNEQIEEALRRLERSDRYDGCIAVDILEIANERNKLKESK